MASSYISAVRSIYRMRRNGGMSAVWLIGGIVVVGIIGYFIYTGSLQQEAALNEELPAADSSVPTQKEGPMRLALLLPVSEAGVSGVAVFSETIGGTTLVDVNLENPIGNDTYAAHIHEGTCSALGEIIYDLASVTDTSSQTVLNAAFADVTGALPRSVAVHAGADQTTPPAVCGEIEAETPPVDIGMEDTMLPVPGDGSNTNGANGAVTARPLREVSITGKNFEFSQTEIRVQKGDFVRITFTSTGGFHDWSVDEFNARTDQVSAGGTASVDFVADKAGAFEYYCSVGSHRQLGMVGTLIVEE